jgi:hypothetical protein
MDERKITTSSTQIPGANAPVANVHDTRRTAGDNDRVRRAQRPCQGGRHAQPQDGQRLGHALPQAGGGTGVGLAELAGKLGQLGPGLQHRLGVAGLPHPPLGHGPQPFRQLVPDVFDLVLLMPTSA